MASIDPPSVATETAKDVDGIMRTAAETALCAKAGRLDIDPDKVKNGLGQLVLTLVKLLHELLERQALRRIDTGGLSEEEVERLGVTLMRQAEEIDRLREVFNLDEDDLNIDLGPLGRLL
jgi:hypothetical protein